MTDPLALALIQQHFHALIAVRAQEHGVPVPTDLPVLDLALLAVPGEQWFAVPGMYGGFAYRMLHGPQGLALHCSSWCRVVGGSGMAHTITKEGAVRTRSGFV